MSGERSTRRAGRCRYGRQGPGKNNPIVDTSAVKFVAARVVFHASGRESTLWEATLQNGKRLFVISVRRPIGQPYYDRGVLEEDEAHAAFHRMTGGLH